MRCSVKTRWFLLSLTIDSKLESTRMPLRSSLKSLQLHRTSLGVFSRILLVSGNVTRCLNTNAQYQPNYHPTIYALSTKLGRAAIGVIRITGSQSLYIYNSLTRTRSPPKPRFTSVRKIYSPTTETLLDEALTVYFKSPKTYTGEDLLELHLHGGTAIIQSVLKAIQQLHSPEKGIFIRYAENGEFSRRAFLNGRFDLTELEGIREMIDAETESQRLSALLSLTGETKRVFQRWREQIVNNVALLTTVIDFGEDHDLEEVAELFDVVDANITQLSQEIHEYLRRVKGSEVLLKGIKLTLLGPPNAGKSSLLNYLANQEAAIVSEIAGTTRDIIDVPIDIGGYKVVVGDTAGIRDVTSADTIEVEGIKRAKNKALVGDLIVVVLPANTTEALHSELIDHVSLLKKENRRILVVLNKEDLLEDDKENTVRNFSKKIGIPLDSFKLVSCKTGAGISGLIVSLTDAFKAISLSDKADPISISARAQDLIRNDVLYGFEQFQYWKQQEDVVLASESLKQAVDGIGKVTGESVGVEEILGVVFSSFCIGK